MKKINRIRIISIFFLLFYFRVISVFANTVTITENGKTATLKLPLKAVISADSIVREHVTVIPLSSLYEHVSWDKSSNKFREHQFLVRVMKDAPSSLLFEIINDAYTCSYNNPDRLVTSGLPADISQVNKGYKYRVTVPGGRQIDLGGGRSTTISEQEEWLSAQGNNGYFIDLTLNITFPDVAVYPVLMNKGGICRGSVTMLISQKL
ncbi:hypothetical protein MVS59_004378 [Salmonella enterica]|nr:hypothetical protein [Salmonella enterica subsp. diarizonae serovar 48:i:z]EEH1875091.1 hypothetical protein [Salmonella enterica]EEM2739081.1 hypothetical protein [Salmonella enterica]EEM9676504.1 hypothetical protein [Salmonella enterica]EEN5935300.1 hypothetical protein [Salmonella enterica]